MTNPAQFAAVEVKAILVMGGFAAALVAAAEWLLFDQPVGSTLGAFATAWALGVLALRRLWSVRQAMLAAALAVSFALVLLDRPGVLALLLFFTALSMANLLAAGEPFDDVWRWAQRLLLHGAISAVGPLIDAVAIRRELPPGQARRVAATTLGLLAPVIGGVIFLILFSQANPLIEAGLDNIRFPRLDETFFERLVFAVLVLLATWSTLRPRLRRPFVRFDRAFEAPPTGLSSLTIMGCLIVFNAVFALENGLDVAFLWSGAPLPAGVTLAEYAHRGAYTLIFTALLAGLFVIVALRPGSATARAPLVRALVVLWIAQNLLLVASSVLRTFDYIEAYSLTRLRIAALVWMGLVACGLLLICWRLLREKSAGWLINANGLAAGVVLALSSVIDYGAVAAAWNVRHAYEVDGAGAGLDLCYLRRLGSSGLVSLVRLQREPGLSPQLRNGLATAIADEHHDMRARLSSLGWTWRDQRRLDTVRRLSGGDPSPPQTLVDCLGANTTTTSVAPAAPAPAAPPLTSQAGR